MNDARKISRIRLLMVISHLLLTLFVIQWLVTRYAQEKSTLKKELTREFVESEEKMLDSLLMVKVVDPFLQKKGKPHFQMLVVRDSSKLNILRHRVGNNKIERDCITVKNAEFIGHKPQSINIRIESKSDDDTTIIATNKADFVGDSLKSVNFRDKFLIQSIKVLSSKTPDLKGSKGSVFYKNTADLDSSILLKEFGKKVLANNFRLTWVRNDSTKKANAQLYFQSGMLDNRLGVNVEHFSFYLFRKIFPQIIFGLILILLTGASFIIAFVSLKKQVQLNKIRNDFVGNISHELKTPVATVKVALEALQSFNIKSEPVKADEYIQIAQIEMNRLDMLIQKVLTSSVYDEAHELMQQEPLLLKDVVDEVIKSMQIRLNQAESQLTVDYGDENLTVFADRMHLQGVLINLIDNCIKYVEGKPSISIKIFREGANVILTVSDNGIGIPEEYLDKVFDKFFRVPNGNRHNVKGYGLGLSYAAMVMKQHKGDIRVENLKEGGCKFSLTFPKYS